MSKETHFYKVLFFLKCLAMGLCAFFVSVSNGLAKSQSGVLRGKVTINGSKAGDAVVALMNKDGSPFASAPMEKTIAQEELQFSPVFSIVTLGAAISFENRDDTIHNVWSRSPTNPFDIGSHLPKTIKQVVLKNKGAVSLRCKVHSEMNALVYVSSSPFFAATDKDGHFEIRGIPFGAYEVETWHASLAPKEMGAGRQFVEITSETAAIQLAFKSRAGAEKDLTNVAGQNWPPVVEEIQVALTKALSSWKKKRNTSAAAKVMSSQSRLYRGSGLRSAIANTLGEPRAIDYETRFDQIRKWVQGLTKDPVLESELKQAIDNLVDNLKKDLQVLEGL